MLITTPKHDNLIYYHNYTSFIIQGEKMLFSETVDKKRLNFQMLLFGRLFLFIP